MSSSSSPSPSRSTTTTPTTNRAGTRAHAPPQSVRTRSSAISTTRPTCRAWRVRMPHHKASVRTEHDETELSPHRACTRTHAPPQSVRTRPSTMSYLPKFWPTRIQVPPPVPHRACSPTHAPPQSVRTRSSTMTEPVAQIRAERCHHDHRVDRNTRPSTPPRPCSIVWCGLFCEVAMTDSKAARVPATLSRDVADLTQVAGWCRVAWGKRIVYCAPKRRRRPSRWWC